MSKAGRIVSNFPAFVRASERTKLLYEVVKGLAQPIEEADLHLFRIQRAHRVKVAEHAEDIVRLAAALGLTPFHFEDLLADENLAYDQKLDLMRERIQRIALVHLTGLGTPWAVMEAAAIFLNAEIVPERPGDLLIKHEDAENFSHKAIIEFSHLPEKPRAQLYLHENPLRRQKIDPAERWLLDSWEVKNENVEASSIKLSIQGISDRTVLPSIFCPDTQEGILFDGIVPDGGTLVIDDTNGARLDGVPVDDWLVYFRGGISEFNLMDRATIAVDQGTSPGHFDGEVENLVAPAFQVSRDLPTARVGRSEWRFKVAEGVYDRSDFDYAVIAPPYEPIGLYDHDFNFDESVFAYPASGVIGMAWDGRTPCSFKLLLPGRIPPLSAPPAQSGKEPAPAGQGQGAGPTVNYVGRLGNLLPRFKAAGVRAYVDIAREAWILGEGVLRGPSASPGAADSGEGIDFHTTQVRSLRADLFVPLENA